ncbi:MAG: hypothetical protein LUQ57_00930, partial [Methylococcaceae bacterium]|nr:hypothetical protein [Methylococcaceae bacterium]
RCRNGRKKYRFFRLIEFKSGCPAGFIMGVAPSSTTLAESNGQAFILAASKTLHLPDAGNPA